ncbi:hypothetical protein PE067_06750 [Paracoccus sp. DMF-8]|uniref:hypothetical protein n=1 Tax=Paracoccus sp. DMF-8 TaxID=3019445 RepID=UPI0023E7682E|nr:hypothetical protein [Paracoccus sp. DMF-8]MDF3605874.1 hypothetical protein [Paracoccus sp. DMF-8]
MQLAGIVLCVGTGVVTGTILAFVLSHTIGLRVDEEDQAVGLDQLYWGLKPVEQEPGARG